MTFVKVIGVTLAFALAVDAVIVRAFLVPAAMHLMGDFNWWSPINWSGLLRQAGGEADNGGSAEGVVGLNGASVQGLDPADGQADNHEQGEGPDSKNA